MTTQQTETPTTIGYKLTDANHHTKNDTQWGENITHETSGDGALCGPGWLHYYEHPLLAVLHNPVHANIPAPVLWECRVEGSIKRDGYMKAGCTKLTTLRVIPLPEVTTAQRVRYAILCTKQRYTDQTWLTWADKWLNGSDRTGLAAVAAARAAGLAAGWVAARVAARAAEAAEDAGWAAEDAGWAAARAAGLAAGWAAEWAAEDAEPLNLIDIALEAVKDGQP